MALARIKKIEIIGLLEEQTAVLELLQKLASIELLGLDAEKGSPIAADDPLETDLDRLDEAIARLAPYGKKSGFIEGMAGLKPFLYSVDLEAALRNYDWRAVAAELDKQLLAQADLLQKQTKLEQSQQHLLPWQDLPYAVDALTPSRLCDFALGTISSRDQLPMLHATAAAGVELHSEVISQDKAVSRMALIFFKADFERLDAILKDFHFTFENFGPLKGTIRDNLADIKAELKNIERGLDGIQEHLEELAGEESLRLKMMRDRLSQTHAIRMTGKRLSRQSYTFTLAGWIKERDVGNIQDRIAADGHDLALFVTDPRPDDDVPVILENRKLVRPFEFITQIYGMPKYGELDPTPFLAPFFFLYFGFCVSDAGYGLILVLASWLILKKFTLGPTGTNFWKMFLMCGLSTVLIGVLTGSWFGNLFEILGENVAALKPLVKWKDALVLLDPMKEPSKLLGVALGFGVIQVWFGNIVAALGNLKNRRYLDILFDQVPMLCLLFGLTGFGLTFLQLLGKGLTPWFRNATLLGGLGIILTQGRSEKGLGSKIFFGIYNLYNALSGYLSDIMSYSRLWALGLVTGVMALTINLLALQFSRLLPAILNFLVLLLLFILGHFVSLMMNLLGAFVHPLRLQFVEFFSKFFKSGGNRFQPFKNETKYINIKY